MRLTRLPYLLLLSSALLVADDNPKLSKDLDGVNPGSTVNVIIQYKHAPTDQDHQKMQSKGATHESDLAPLNGAVYSVKASAVASLSSDPNVAYISINRPVYPLLDYSTRAINADVAAAAGYLGTGIGIAVIDSGISDSDDLKGPGAPAAAAVRGPRVVYRQSFIKGDGQDHYGHGTHVAGI